MFVCARVCTCMCVCCLSLSPCLECLWPLSPIPPNPVFVPGYVRIFLFSIVGFLFGFSLFAKEMNPPSSVGFITSFLCRARPSVGLLKVKSTVPTACHLKNRLIFYNHKKTCYKGKFWGYTPVFLLLYLMHNHCGHLTS